MSCSVLSNVLITHEPSCVPPRTRKCSPQPENPSLPHLIYQDLLIDLSQRENSDRHSKCAAAENSSTLSSPEVTIVSSALYSSSDRDFLYKKLLFFLIFLFYNLFIYFYLCLKAYNKLYNFFVNYKDYNFFLFYKNLFYITKKENSLILSYLKY